MERPADEPGHDLQRLSEARTAYKRPKARVGADHVESVARRCEANVIHPHHAVVMHVDDLLIQNVPLQTQVRSGR